MKVQNVKDKFLVNYNRINELIGNHSKYISNEIENIKSNVNIIKESNEELKQQVSGLLEQNLTTKIDFLLTRVTKLEEQQNRLLQLDYVNLEYLLLPMNEKRPKVLITGFLGAPNLGDELMLESLLERFAGKNLDITVLLSENAMFHPQNKIPVHYLHLPKNPCDCNILANHFDCLIWAGGAHIDDKFYEVQNSYKWSTGTLLIELSKQFLIFEKQVYFLGLSSNTKLENQRYINELEYLIENITFASLRDPNSAKILEDVFRKKPNIEIINDIVLASSKIKPQDLNKRTNSNRIGIVWICTEESTEKLEYQIKQIQEYNQKRNIDYQIDLIPFYDYLNNDTVIYEKVIEKCKLKNVNILPVSNNIEEIQKIFLKEDIVIALRYHAVLLCYANNVPCIPICYDIHPHYENKIKQINNLFDHNEVISYKELDKSIICEKIDEVIKKEAIKNSSNLKRISKILQESCMQLDDIVMKLIKGLNIKEKR